MQAAKSQSPKGVRRRARGTLPCFVLLLVLTMSCRNDMDKVLEFDPKQYPQQNLDSVRAVRSLGGKRQMVLKSSKVVVFDQPEKKTVYPHGIDMQLFSGDVITASITADSAISMDERKLVEAYGNVVIIDYRSGDTSYLNSIVWNSAEHSIFSNDPVRSVNGTRVTYGDGFRSDDEFTTPQILHQRGTMTIDE